MPHSYFEFLNNCVFKMPMYMPRHRLLIHVISTKVSNFTSSYLYYSCISISLEAIM